MLLFCYDLAKILLIGVCSKKSCYQFIITTSYPSQCGLFESSFIRDWNKIQYLFIQFIGDSIKCWVCRSDGDPKCADPFDNTSFPIADCRTEQPREHLPGLEPTMCRKVRQKGMMNK